MFKVQCTSCRETNPNWVGVSRFVRSGLPNLYHPKHVQLTTFYQEQNDMSGSRGEANFVMRCKECKVWRSCGSTAINQLGETTVTNTRGQRESSASIREAPKAYEQSEPAKPKNILEFDCRGLEFTEFKPEVGGYQYPSRCPSSSS